MKWFFWLILVLLVALLASVVWLLCFDKQKRVVTWMDKLTGGKDN